MNENIDINALRASLGLDGIADALKNLSETQRA